jgi:hypothetical protein
MSYCSPLFFSVMSVMSVMSVVVLRYSEYTLDATLNAADDPADCTAHDFSDRTGRLIAFLGPFFRALNDPLSLRCQGHRKNDEHQ